jgi:adenylate cyclase
MARDAAIQASWAVRHSLLLLGVAPIVPQVVGSAVNIWYNIIHIKPLLSAAQLEVFLRTIAVFNVTVYPLALLGWIWALYSLWGPWRGLMAGRPVSSEMLLRGRRRVINLPWWGMGLCGSGWLLCIPVFLTVLSRAPGTLDPRLYAHLPISFLISALIAITHSFFAIELLSHRYLYPVFFRDTRPADVPGTLALSLQGRGLLWAVSAGLCPIASLLLLMLAPHDPGGTDTPWFALAVGGLGIGFGLTTAWMVGLLVTEPVKQLKQAAQRVAGGDLGVQVALLRADEFGPLIDEFNQMIVELREKNRLKETLGTHVGQQAARQILTRDPGLGGVEEEVTVMFADIRNFSARCAASAPQEAVSLLNLFLAEMVEVVEQKHDGMVNKFLGDGFMALFGTWNGQDGHADAAVMAGRDMLARLEALNARLVREGQLPLAIGIGIHTGRAVVGSLGSPRRMEYTAIGNTVNVASRVEELTKLVGESLLLTAATYAALRASAGLEALPPQQIKGHTEPIVVYRLARG